MDSENAAVSGIEAAVSGIEGEEKPIRVASGFVAKLQIINTPSAGIFCPGLRAVLNVGDAVEMECEVGELMEQIDLKTMKPMEKKPIFVRSKALVVCRIKVENIDELSEVFYRDPTQFRKFTLRGLVGKKGDCNTIARGIITGFPALG